MVRKVSQGAADSYSIGIGRREGRWVTQSTSNVLQGIGLERQVGVSSINYHKMCARCDNKVASVFGEQTNAGARHESVTQARQ